MAGAVAGREDDVDVEAGELQLLAALDGLVGVVGLERAEARPRDVAHDVGEHAASRAPGSRPARRSRWRAGATAPTWSKCVWVSRIASTVDAELVDRAEQLRPPRRRGRRSPRGRVLSRRSDEAVLLHRPDGEHADVHCQRLRRRSAFLRLAAAVEEQVGVVAQRDVDEQQEAAEPERRAGLLLEEQDQRAATKMTDGDQRAVERRCATSAACRAGRRARSASSRLPRSCARPSVGLRPVRPRDSTMPAALPRCLVERFFLVCAIWPSSVERPALCGPSPGGIVEDEAKGATMADDEHTHEVAHSTSTHTATSATPIRTARTTTSTSSTTTSTRTATSRIRIRTSTRRAPSTTTTTTTTSRAAA